MENKLCPKCEIMNLDLKGRFLECDECGYIEELTIKEIRPCPFCGGEDIRFSNKTSAGGSKRHVTMFCNDCHCYSPRTLLHVKREYYTSDERQLQGREEALEAWNKRK